MEEKKVLIVEDEQAIAELESDYLEIDGIESDIVADGRMAVDMVKRNAYSLVLLDIMLPGLNGFEVCKKIREIKDIPILFVSARKSDVDKIRGLGLGADDYITKPFSPSELVARVKAHINRYLRLKGDAKDDPVNDVIEIRGLTIDKTAHKVFVNGQEKILTTKEFDILSFLAQNPNRVYSKEDLFNKIWDMDAIGEVATVTVHIKKIREKIEKNEKEPEFIETIWGVGYRFKG
ncbi:MAG: response regulator transcription factor [Lachnospiraceae bacterium]|nr:response regulator transcription factor [Lachnospiraceae bacterium]